MDNAVASMKNILFPIFLFLLIGCSTKEQRNEKPNILLFIADDMSFGHTSYDGFPEVQTPNIDRLINTGVYFTNAHCSAPSCSPSRAAVLTGRNGYELEEGAVLWGFLPSKFQTYPDILEEEGYFIGFTGKGWGPGSIEDAGRSHNPAGFSYNEIRHMPFEEYGNEGQIYNVDYAANFKSFIDSIPNNQPFCFWMGTIEPHRPYVEGIGKKSGKNLGNIDVPEFLIDNEQTRSDIADYLFEIEWFDKHIGQVLDHLDSLGKLNNTLIIVTSDNGMPFPRAKSNLYEYGTHMPLIAWWGDEIKEAIEINEFVSLADIAPTFLDAAGVTIPDEISRKSFLPLIVPEQSSEQKANREYVVTYKERHAWVHPDGQMAASRAIHMGDYLFIHNLFPDMWPAGHIDPFYNWDLYPFGDADGGRAKTELLKARHTQDSAIFKLAFGKRPEFELYNVKTDPYNLTNLAFEEEFQGIREKLRLKLHEYLLNTNDPRITGDTIVFYQTPYYAIKGLSTGGLFLEDWNSLDSLQKAEERRKQLEILRNHNAELEAYGW